MDKYGLLRRKCNIVSDFLCLNNLNKHNFNINIRKKGSKVPMFSTCETKYFDNFI